MHKSFVRTAFAFSLLGAALSAQALSVYVVSAGPVEFGVHDITQYETVIKSAVEYPLPNFTRYVFQDYFPPSYPESKSYQYFYDGGVINLSVVGDTWTLKPTIMGSLGEMKGSGTIHTLYIPGEQSGFDLYSMTFLSGDIHSSAVPEPASLAALGVGLVAIVRRRKRS